MATSNSREEFFNPSVDNQPQAYTDRSRGVDSARAQQYSDAAIEGPREYATQNYDDMASTAWMEGVSNIWKMGVDMADTFVKNRITGELTDQIDNVRDTAIGILPASTEIPADLKSGGKQMQRITQAHKQGQMSDVHYYANLDYLSRSMRQRFPGYRDYIDSTMQAQAGVNPANALRSAMQRASSAGDEKRTAQEKFIDDNAGIIQATMPGTFEKIAKGGDIDENEYGQIRAGVARAKAKDYVRQQYREDIAARTDVDKDKGRIASEAFNSEVYNDFDINQMAVTNTLTANGTATLDEILKSTRDQNSLGGVSVTPDEENAIGVALNEYEGKMWESYNQKLNYIDPQTGRSYAQDMTPEAKKTSRSEFEDLLKTNRERITNKDYGMLGEAERRQKNTDLSEQQRFLAGSRAARASRTLTAAFGNPQAAARALEDPAFQATYTGDIAKILTKEYWGDPSGDPPPAKNVGDEASKMGVRGESEKGKAVKAYTDASLSKIKAKDTPDNIKTNQIMSIYGPKNQGMVTRISVKDNENANLNTNSGRQKFILQASAPDLLAEVKAVSERTGNKDLWEHTKGWVVDSATINMRNDISAAQDVVVSDQGTMRYSGESKSLVFDPFRESSSASPIGGTRDPIAGAGRNALNNINRNLAAITNVMKADGRSDDEINEALTGILTNPQGLGLNMSATAGPTLWSKISTAADEFYSSIGSGEGKSSFKPADSRRMNLGGPTEDKKNLIQEFVSYLGSTSDDERLDEDALKRASDAIEEFRAKRQKQNNGENK